jgi:hypothetical protein
MCNLYQSRGQQQPMLISVIEDVQHPESLIPSFIWADSVENLNGYLPKAWYLCDGVPVVAEEGPIAGLR